MDHIPPPARRLVRLATLVVLAATSAGGLLAGDAGVPARAEDAREPAGSTGAIEGRVVLRLPPARRAPARYPGRGAPARDVQRLPAVVYLVGPASPPLVQPPVMAQQDTLFSPGVLVVPVGTTVSFPNRDPFFHNVFSYSSPARFDLGRFPRGESKSVTFDEPGVVKVYCEVHESMRGAILVLEGRHHALVEDDGTFVLRDAPAGSWTLVAWHADLGTTETAVTVAEGATTRVELELGG